MEIFIGGVILTIVLGSVAIKCHPYSALEPICGVFSMFFGVVTVIAIIAIPLNRISIEASIHRLEAIRETVNSARERGDEIERFSLAKDIAEANRYLAEAKYLNSTIYSIWIPDSINDVEPIR
jgi:hypothetical protein